MSSIMPEYVFGTEESVQLESFSLTHFQYLPGDGLGMFLAFSSLFPIFLIVMQTTIVLSRREIIGVLFLLGQLLNELFNLCLKFAFRQHRPNLHFGDGYGMPSSHSQFMGFFAAFVVLYLQHRITTNNLHKILVQAGAVGLSILVIMSRVYLGYHTLPQVCVGTVVGVASGCFWLWLIENVVYPSGVVDRVLESGISKWLLLRDSRSIRDIALAEYNLFILAKDKEKHTLGSKRD